MNNISVTKIENKVKFKFMAMLCIVILFVLRIPFLGFLTLILGVEHSAVLYPIFEIGTYFFTALFIWTERDRLKEYHMDTISVFIFTLGPLWYKYSDFKIRIPMMIIGLILLAALIASKHKFSRVTMKNIRWIIIGMAAGAVTAVISSFFLSKQVNNTGMKATFSLALISILTQLTNAAILEEPFFRGILWGALKKLRWKDGWIYITQALLFWIGHIYYINTYPYSFWIVVPLASLVLGILAWRSRSIATSMAAHGMINGLGQILTFYKL
ncbi:CPBP family intramembrane glutamic endopeptidase [Clostridium sp. JN-9]|uniref:CPBP family intramembrane glutamic endopeptidase n=1 Tax=Clostridium sp. JN-9 TaxID=2507159 RepID=UPI000FFE2077|nr:CPBP family intramembrane glutamic endopeptidase [Clostridium sp. JN-9]QAT39974.1 CPBP family intramembrane metalloprotease [Clostridium sp. JN-9]